MRQDETTALLQELESMRQRLGALERQRRRTTRVWLTLALVAVLSTAGLALASVPCPNGIPFCFVADEPALATEVNANFAALKTWLEAKVGATGTLAAPSRDIVSNRIAGVNYAPLYSEWGSTALGAGGASIVNDNNTYRALMVVGNSSGNGSTRVVRLFDDVAVSSNLSVGSLSGHQVSCAVGTNGYHFGFCCRMNTRTGATECKHGTNVNFSSWGSSTFPFAASTDGFYWLSCAGHSGSANWPICCRTAANGSTSCMVSSNGGPLTWSATAIPW